jgi:mycothiol system anti-sigma-R factor
MGDAEADCRSFLARLYLYLDGEIDALERADLDRHLERCTGCLRHYGFERDLKVLIRKKCQEQPSTEVIERLRIQIRSYLA